MRNKLLVNLQPGRKFKSPQGTSWRRKKSLTLLYKNTAWNLKSKIDFWSSLASRWWKSRPLHRNLVVSVLYWAVSWFGLVLLKLATYYKTQVAHKRATSTKNPLLFTPSRSGWKNLSHRWNTDFTTMLHWEPTVACGKQTLTCNYSDTVGQNNRVKKVRQHWPLLRSTPLST